MCSSCACAARIVATRSSNGLLNSSVGPQSGFAFASRVRIIRARRRRATGSSRPRFIAGGEPPATPRGALRAAGFLGARGTATPVRSPTAGRDPADRTGAVGSEVQPFIAVVALDEDDRAVRRPREVEEVLRRVVELAALSTAGIDHAEPVMMRLRIDDRVREERRSWRPAQLGDVM